MLTHIRAVGSARRELVALQRGEYISLGATEQTLVFARRAGASVAIVGLSKANEARTVDISVGPASVRDGTMLRDRLSSATVMVSGGSVRFTIPPWGAAILAP
jgi:hypothetical protein